MSTITLSSACASEGTVGGLFASVLTVLRNWLRPLPKAADEGQADVWSAGARGL